MQVTVELQDKFSALPIVLLGIVVVLIIVLIIIWSFTKPRSKPEKVKPAKVAEPKIKDMPSIREKYDRQLIMLEAEYMENRLSDREAFQKLSSCIRQFACEMTGVQMYTYTLMQLRESGIPQLTNLIEECYAPEFSVEGQGDVCSTIHKARKVIKEWV